jgi:protein-disulfide isomerase
MNNFRYFFKVKNLNFHMAVSKKPKKVESKKNVNKDSKKKVNSNKNKKVEKVKNNNSCISGSCCFLTKLKSFNKNPWTILLIVLVLLLLGTSVTLGLMVYKKNNDSNVVEGNLKEVLLSYAEEIDLDEDEFEECLDSSEFSDQINAETTIVEGLGIQGTPAFIVGQEVFVGAQDFKILKYIIDKQLSGEKPKVNLDSLVDVKEGEKHIIIPIDENCFSCVFNEEIANLDSSFMFISSILGASFTDSKIYNIDSNSKEISTILKTNDIKVLPVIFFSIEFESDENWEKIKPYSTKVEIDGKGYFMLDKGLPVSYLIEEINLGDGIVSLGNKNSKVKVIEISDFACPFCGIAEGNEELLEQFKTQKPDYMPPATNIKKDYVNNKKISYRFLNNPILSLHPNVMPAHLASMCANKKGKFDEYSNKLFKNQKKWSSLK